VTHKLVSKGPEELAAASRDELLALVTEEPTFSAATIHELAQRQTQHHMEISGALWSAYSCERAEWLQTYRAALTGSLAAGMAAPDAHERAEYCAKLAHGDPPEKPKS